MSNTQASSKMISLVPTNGTQWDLKAGQKIIWELPPNLGLVKGRDSHLAFDIVPTCSDNRRLALNTMAGIDAVIARVDIYSLANSAHIETLQNYNQWCAIDHQYLYEDKTNLQALNGCGHKVYASIASGAPVKPLSNEVENTILSPIKSDGTEQYSFRRYTTPLKAGILRWWDDERLCPILAFGGLRIEMTLENPKVALNYLVAVSSTGTEYDLSPVDNTQTPSNVKNGGVQIADNESGNTIATEEVFASVEDTGLSVGNLITITYGATDATTGTEISDAVITGLSINGSNKLEVVYTGTAIPATQTDIYLKFRTDTRAAIVRPQMRVLSIAPTQEVIASMGNGFKYEFTSYDYLTSTLLASATRHQIEVNSVATRAVCLMSSFVDTTLQEEGSYSSYFQGSVPSKNDITSIQYFLNNRLYPVRAYDPRLKKDRIVALHELVKAFDSISKEAKDLGNADGSHLEYYTNTFLIARQLAKRGYFYNLRDAEGQVRLQLDGTTRTSPFQINNYVWSKKVVEVSADGTLEVML